jgi:gas vesicle protein GvpK
MTVMQSGGGRGPSPTGLADVIETTLDKGLVIDAYVRVSLRIDADPEAVEKGLVTLMLTIVELLRQLMERQALRRVEQGSLSDDQIEKIGSALMALNDRMAELRDHFGLRPQDLNLDLGPLGPLLPYD